MQLLSHHNNVHVCVYQQLPGFMHAPQSFDAYSCNKHHITVALSCCADNALFCVVSPVTALFVCLNVVSCVQLDVSIPGYLATRYPLSQPPPPPVPLVNHVHLPWPSPSNHLPTTNNLTTLHLSEGGYPTDHHNGILQVLCTAPAPGSGRCPGKQERREG